MKKKIKTKGGNLLQMRQKVESIIIQHWQEEWTAKFAWREGESNVHGNLTRVLC